LPAERPLDERALEHAIQVAEDGLMLHATRLRGYTLTAQDHDGRLGQGLSYVLNMAAVRWRVDEIESMFGRVIELETRWVPPPTLEHRQGFVADLRVLRELAHHGRLHEVRLHAAAQQSEVAR
jgi:hypothetical protein